ncbi:MAG: hypothetical protein JWN94_3644 [Betaproteobacteria bacterium]|nr:hypothetical protein [Betaproteobacteria bacterium]
MACRLNNRTLFRAAGITLALMLFSALSPAMAATLFAGESQVLGKMLGVPTAQSDAVPATGHEHHSAPQSEQHQHHQHHQQQDQSTEETKSGECVDHGVFCSFCLSAGSTTTLVSPAPTLFHLVAAAGNEIFPPAVARLYSIHKGARHLRDPPPYSG